MKLTYAFAPVTQWPIMYHQAVPEHQDVSCLPSFMPDQRKKTKAGTDSKKNEFLRGQKFPFLFTI